MPSTLSYPGVYIEEIPSGVRTITGVATSITAFIGRALRGPVDEPVTITSYADFERTFGGLWRDSSLGYAVRDFYRHGGSLAIVVRVHKPKTNDSASISLGAGNRRLALRAASPGRLGIEAERDRRRRRQGPVRHDAVQPHGHRHRSGDGQGRESFATSRSRPTAPAGSISCSRRSRRWCGRRTRCRPSRSRRFPQTAAATNGNDGNDVDKDLYTTGTNLRANKKGLYALGEGGPGQPRRRAPVHGHGRGRLRRARRHDRLCDRTTRGRDHGSAGGVDERRHGRDRRQGGLVPKQQERRALLPPDPAARPRAGRPDRGLRARGRGRRASSPAPTPPAGCGRRRPGSRRR